MKTSQNHKPRKLQTKKRHLMKNIKFSIRQINWLRDSKNWSAKMPLVIELYEAALPQITGIRSLTDLSKFEKKLINKWQAIQKAA